MQNLGTVKVKYSFGLGANLLLLAGAGAVLVHTFKKIVELDTALEANRAVTEMRKGAEGINEMAEKLKNAEIKKETSEENTEDAKQENEES